MAETAYVVFELKGGPPPGPNGRGMTWTEIGRAKAVSSKAAIAAVIGESIPDGQIIVATPERSWQPITVKREVKLSFS